MGARGCEDMVPQFTPTASATHAMLQMVKIVNVMKEEMVDIFGSEFGVFDDSGKGFFLISGKFCWGFMHCTGWKLYLMYI